MLAIGIGWLLGAGCGSCGGDLDAPESPTVVPSRSSDVSGGSQSSERPSSNAPNRQVKLGTGGLRIDRMESPSPTEPPRGDTREVSPSESPIGTIRPRVGAGDGVVGVRVLGAPANRVP